MGGNPFDATSIYALIHYLERKWGVYFCMGGTGKLVAELKALMIRGGVDLKLDTDITEICVAGKKVTGVRTAETFIAADNVIYNADHQLFTGRCSLANPPPQKVLPEAITHYSMGLFVLFGTWLAILIWPITRYGWENGIRFAS